MILTGGSGAKLVVNGDILIKEDGKRLYKQAIKQERFYNNCAPYKVPRIFSISTKDNRCSISMEYIQNAQEISKDQSIGHFYNLTAFFSTILLPQSTETTIHKSQFQDKLAGIELPLDLFQYAQGILNDCQIKIPYLHGLNHGDFTTNNILFDGKEYWLIDFLDTFINSPLQDYSKLFQELIINNQPLKPYINALNLIQLHEYKTFINLSSLFNFLRMFPYLPTGERKNKIKQIIENEQWIIA